jgi:hypothetical protein
MHSKYLRLLNLPTNNPEADAALNPASMKAIHSSRDSRECFMAKTTIVSYRLNGNMILIMSSGLGRRSEVNTGQNGLMAGCAGRRAPRDFIEDSNCE